MKEKGDCETSVKTSMSVLLTGTLTMMNIAWTLSCSISTQKSLHVKKKHV